ncbi:SMI1/KNR4 family protein [Fodinicola feengrottensis]|uniref:SMI1/KNR4 family protein n=1 Tax=Fodinicola feengrottensis TaxID=435914 RepID=UPI0013CFFEBF|nr:SMI1/KNR4 family protein [Fodinicola feengrottensis]
MRSRNGGVPCRSCCPAPNSTTYAEDHVEIDDIMGIGREQYSSLGGGSGSAFWIQDWEYPAIGVYFGTTPSAGHDMIAFDYRECGPDGEPRVVHVGQEDDYRITVLAPDFCERHSGAPAQRGSRRRRLLTLIAGLKAKNIASDGPSPALLPTVRTVVVGIRRWV